jgi:hypothetical protein
MEHIKELQKAAKAYLQARKIFLDIANNTKELDGNDNIMGRIGEFIAYQFLEKAGRKPLKNINKTQKGYDIECDEEKKTQVSVKLISSENKTERTTRLKEPWDELILIELGESEVVRIGHLIKEQFNRALLENPKHSEKQYPKFSEEPYIKKTMLNSKGLIGKYGVVYSSEKVKEYL